MRSRAPGWSFPMPQTTEVLYGSGRSWRSSWRARRMNRVSLSGESSIESSATRQPYISAASAVPMAAQGSEAAATLFTAEAVELAASTSTSGRFSRSHRRHWAAIGTALAAEMYGCRVAEDSIEDSPDNDARFILLARQEERQDLPEPYKTSVVCGIGKDQPGALLLILQEFAHRYINLTKIESRPSKRGLGDYVFLMDMEGSREEPAVREALRCLSCKLPRLTILGSYPVDK